MRRAFRSHAVLRSAPADVDAIAITCPNLSSDPHVPILDHSFSDRRHGSAALVRVLLRGRSYLPDTSLQLRCRSRSRSPRSFRRDEEPVFAGRRSSIRAHKSHRPEQRRLYFPPKPSNSQAALPEREFSASSSRARQVTHHARAARPLRTTQRQPSSARLPSSGSRSTTVTAAGVGAPMITGFGEAGRS